MGANESQPLSFLLGQLEKQVQKNEMIEGELNSYKSVMDIVCHNSGMMIIKFNDQGIITYINRVAENTLMYQAEDVVGQVRAHSLHLEEELKYRAEELGAEITSANGDPINYVELVEKLKVSDNEWHFVRKDGTRILVSVHIIPPERVSKGYPYHVMLAIDITEKKKPEMELRAALKKEKELNELKSRFVSMASHEFRTPLGAVLSSAYLVSKYKKEEQQSQREKHIGNIVSSVNNLTEILDDFLSVGKIEEGNINPQFVRFDIKEFIFKMIHDVGHLKKQYQTISYVHEGAISRVTLDHSMLRHVVLNLLSNAIKFSTDESTIEVYTFCDDTKFILKVKDYGIGIPEEEQSNLFKIFFRSSFAVNIQGTGLGLHIVKKYVEFMGGCINFKSEIGEGTEFTIEFATNEDKI